MLHASENQKFYKVSCEVMFIYAKSRFFNEKQVCYCYHNFKLLKTTVYTFQEQAQERKNV